MAVFRDNHRFEDEIDLRQCPEYRVITTDRVFQAVRFRVDVNPHWPFILPRLWPVVVGRGISVKFRHLEVFRSWSPSSVQH